MSSIYFSLTIVSFVLATIFLITSVVLFFAFKIPSVVKDTRGSLEQKQIEEIRIKNSNAAKRSSAINVFEELESKAKVKINTTHRVSNIVGRANMAQTNTDSGTTVLKKSSQAINENFRIEKNIIFVSTTDILK